MKSPDFHPEPEFLELISLHASEALTAEQAVRLQSLLHESRPHRLFFLRYLQVDTVLRESALSLMEGAPSDPLQAAPHKKSAVPLGFFEPSKPLTRATPEAWYWKAAAAVATLAACVLSLWPIQRPPSPAAPAVTPSVAILTQSVGTQWRPGAPIPQPQGPVARGPLAIEKGILQLEFLSGAILVVEGPAELDLLSPMKAVCHRGKIRATVPPQARGFTISASGMEVVDLGTEFGLSVAPDGKSEVQVITGEVRMQKGNGPKQSLLAGEAVEWSRNVAPAAILKSEARFTDPATLLTLASASTRERNVQWLQQSNAISAAPDTVFHYTFNPSDTGSRTLHNVRPGSPPELHGAIVGCQWTEGRWPGKHALEFKRPSDRVRIAIPGEFDSFTLSAWVRIEGWDRWLNSLLLTEEFRAGAIHWQLSDKGEIILGLKPDKLENHFSPPVITPDDLGRWVFLATVYDANTRTVKHFLDGRCVGQTPVRTHRAVAPGNADIGNWTLNRQPSKECRVLNGRIDELSFSSRALSESEIAQAFEAGRPRG